MSDIGPMGPLFTIVTVKVESVADFNTWANGKKMVKNNFYFLA